MKLYHWKPILDERERAKKVEVKNVGDKLTGNDSKPRACVDCEHHSFERVLRKDDYVYLHYCERPALRDLITGEKTLAQTNRLNEKLCGWHAKYFTAKPEKEVPDL